MHKPSNGLPGRPFPWEPSRQGGAEVENQFEISHLVSMKGPRSADSARNPSPVTPSILLSCISVVYSREGSGTVRRPTAHKPAVFTSALQKTEAGLKLNSYCVQGRASAVRGQYRQSHSMAPPSRIVKTQHTLPIYTTSNTIATAHTK